MTSLPSNLSVDTINLIQSVVRVFMTAGKMFTSVHVTNEVKKLGSKMTPMCGFGRHRDMVKIITDMFPQDMMGYNQVQIALFNPADGSSTSTQLYAPGTASPQDFADFEQNGWVDALPPLVAPTLPSSAPATAAIATPKRGLKAARGQASTAPAPKMIPGPGKTGGPVLGAHILGDL